MPKPPCKFRNLLFYVQLGVVSPRPTQNLEDRPLSPIRDCLFNIFSATHCTCKLSAPSPTWGRICIIFVVYLTMLFQ
jgi:hypothetical protein